MQIYIYNIQQMQISYIRAPPREIVKSHYSYVWKIQRGVPFVTPSWRKTFQKSPGRNQQFGHFRAIRIHIGLGCCMQKVKVFGFSFVCWNVGSPTFGNTAHGRWTLAPVHLYDYMK